MSIKVIWTAQARADLKNIFDFVYKQSQTLTIPRKLVKKVVEKSKLLAKGNLQGTALQGIENAPKEYRYLVQGNYIIIYSNPETNLIYIHTVFDTRQDPEKLKSKL
jgi:toxin ParE1/3/4